MSPELRRRGARQDAATIPSLGPGARNLSLQQDVLTHTRNVFCDMIHRMRLSRSIRKLGDQIEGSIDQACPTRSLLCSFGWVSAGVTALAVGVVIGRELRQRYKFHRRTPYDMYAHAGDQSRDMDFGVGI